MCGAIRTVPHATGVTILQHPAERAHAFNTARLARLALADAAVVVAWEGGRLDPVPLPDGAALLWPGDDAPDLAVMPADARPAHLVLIDGTWPQARSMLKANPWLRALPQVRLAPVTPSDYRIRREPAFECLSTVETLAAALKVCEPGNPALDDLLAGFRAMIDGQLAVRAAVPHAPRTLSSRLRAVERLAVCWDDLVVVYAETTPLSKEPRDREIAQWAALRPASGEVFDGLARPSVVPDACQLRAMQLHASDVEAAPSIDALAEAWAAFRRPDDRFAAWSRGGASAGFIRICQTIPEMFDLKSMYCNVRRGRSGTLDRVVARHRLEPAPVPVRGRAAGRLANSAVVARWLGDQGLEITARRAPDDPTSP